MFLILVFILGVSNFVKAEDTGWMTDFKSAKEKAQQQNEFILLNFSGSDWCGPCIRLKSILTDPAFLKYAATHLILVNADFPRMKKNKLSKDVEQQNDLLADSYDKEGKFPFTVLLNKDLKIMKTWDGYPKFSQDTDISLPDQFVQQVNETISAYAAH